MSIPACISPLLSEWTHYVVFVPLIEVLVYSIDRDWAFHLTVSQRSVYPWLSSRVFVFFFLSLFFFSCVLGHFWLYGTVSGKEANRKQEKVPLLESNQGLCGYVVVMTLWNGSYPRGTNITTSPDQIRLSGKMTNFLTKDDGPAKLNKRKGRDPDQPTKSRGICALPSNLKIQLNWENTAETGLPVPIKQTNIQQETHKLLLWSGRGSVWFLLSL